MTPVAQYDVSKAAEELLLAGFEPALLRYLDGEWLVAQARQAKRRKTPFGPLGTIAAMISQRLHGHSQAATIQLLGLRSGKRFHARCGAISKALRKQPGRLILGAAQQTGRHAAALALRPEPLRICYLDGSGVHLLATPENLAKFPQSTTQAEGAGWPSLRFVALTDAASGAILDLSIGTLNDHDAKLGRPLWDRLGDGDLAVLDCGFSSYGFLWGMAKRGAQTVVRQHQKRKNSQPMPEQIGDVVDFCEVWKRPSKRPQWWDADLPATLTVRIVAKRLSAKEVLIVNTMLPCEAYSAEQVLEFYRGRQRIETGFNELKTTLDTAFLEVGDPQVAVDSLWAAVTTHNLVCCVMSEAAAEVGKSRWELSYKTCLDLLRLSSAAGVLAGPEEAAKRVREELTRYPHPRRAPERQEPRARKASHRPHRQLKGKRADELLRLGR